MPNLNPGDDWQAAVTAGSPGDTFTVKAGTHRLQSVSPKNNQVFTGDPGAIMSGATLLPNFVGGGGWAKDGALARWYLDNQTQQGYQGYVGLGICKVGDNCAYPEDLWFENVLKFHQTTLSSLTTGQWYFDYVANRIYVGDNPTGHVIETSVTTDAFSGAGGATGVTIQGLVIEKYASYPQHGMIHGDGGSGWIVQNNEIRYGHAVGLRTHTSMQVLTNNIHHNGQMGLGGGGNDVIVDGNEIAYNNTCAYDVGFEAGGTKFVQTNRIVVRNNNSHHNDGMGIWFDIENINVTVDSNRVDDNTWYGIFQEIGYACLIRRNICRRNGGATLGWGSFQPGAGIMIAASRGVDEFNNPTGLEVCENYCEDNATAGIALTQQNRSTSFSQTYGEYKIINLNVHDNWIAAPTGSVGLERDAFADTIFTTDNNHWTTNHYFFGDGSTGTYWYWNNVQNTFSAWQTAGNDVGGTYASYASYVPHGTARVGAIVRDSFSGSAGTNLTAHTGETGATWTKDVYTGDFVITDNNALRLNSTATNAQYMASGIPSSNEYDIHWFLAVKTTVANHFYSVGGRMTAGDTGLRVEYDASNTAFFLFRTVAGSNTLLAAVGLALTDNSPCYVLFRIRTAAHQVYVNNLNNVVTMSATDNALASVGVVGLGASASASPPTNTTGFHTDEIIVQPPFIPAAPRAYLQAVTNACRF